MEEQGTKAEECKKPVKGVRGHAAVSRIPFFYRGHSVSSEFIHNVGLGVVRYFPILWFFTAGPWYIGNSLKAVDQFLKIVCIPDFIYRVPRGIKDIKYWKACEFRSWLLYFSLPALYEILPNQ